MGRSEPRPTDRVGGLAWHAHRSLQREVGPQMGDEAADMGGLAMLVELLYYFAREPAPGLLTQAYTSRASIVHAHEQAQARAAEDVRPPPLHSQVSRLCAFLRLPRHILARVTKLPSTLGKHIVTQKHGSRRFSCSAPFLLEQPSRRTAAKAP